MVLPPPHNKNRLSDVDIEAFAQWARERDIGYVFGDVSVLDLFPVRHSDAREHRDFDHLRPNLVFRGDFDARRFTFFAATSALSVGHGARSEVAHTHLACLELPGPCPRLDVGFESVLSPVRRTMGLGDELFGGNDAFDRYFNIDVDETDIRFARDVFTDSTRDWLVNDPLARALPFRFDGGSLVMVGSGPLLNPQQGLDMVAFLYQLYTRVPPGWWRKIA